MLIKMIYKTPCQSPDQPKEVYFAMGLIKEVFTVRKKLRIDSRGMKPAQRRRLVNRNLEVIIQK